LPEPINMVLVATMLAQLLGSLPQLKTLLVEFDGYVEPASSILLVTAILGCRQAKRLFLRPYLIHHDTLPLIVSYIQDHPHLEEFDIDGVSEFSELRPFLRPLTCVEQLSTVKINNTAEIDHDDAAHLGELLGMRTLTKASFHECDFETDESVDVICLALANSNLRQLSLLHCYFPDTCGIALATAVTASKLVTFSCPSLDRPFCDAFGYGLAGSGIKKLELYIAGDIEEPVALLKHASTWQVQDLFLELRNLQWSEDFERAISSYVAANDCLRRLTLLCVEFDGCEQLSIGACLQAFTSGKGSIDEIKITVTVIGNSISDLPWIQKIEKRVASNLNRQRRLHKHRFERISQVDSPPVRQLALTKALAAVDSDACFKFLSANEWQCREVLLHELPTDGGRKKRKLR
jgi:hypothetical protein